MQEEGNELDNICKGSNLGIHNFRYETDYEVNRERSFNNKAEKYVDHFEGMKVTEITTARMNRYIGKKIKGKANAAINRDFQH